MKSSIVRRSCSTRSGQFSSIFFFLSSWHVCLLLNFRINEEYALSPATRFNSISIVRFVLVFAVGQRTTLIQPFARIHAFPALLASTNNNNKLIKILNFSRALTLFFFYRISRWVRFAVGEERCVQHNDVHLSSVAALQGDCALPRENAPLPH